MWRSLGVWRSVDALSQTQSGGALRSGKYSFKSGFKVESFSPDSGQMMTIFGPNVKPLLVFAWKLKCPPKLRYFVWLILSGTLPVSKNLKTQGIDCDLCCSMCGADEESTNHVLFEYPPALRTWAFSRIPSSPAVFPSSSVFTSIDYLFWKMSKQGEFNYSLRYYGIVVGRKW